MIAPPRSHGDVFDQLDHDLFTKFPPFCLLWLGLSTLGNDRTSLLLLFTTLSAQTQGSILLCAPPLETSTLSLQQCLLLFLRTRALQIRRENFRDIGPKYKP